MEELLINGLKEYGYIVLFIWSIMEGELGLIMAGIMSYTGDMVLSYAILVGASGGFIGDQIYFYLGRFNRKYIQKEMSKHRRKFALASLLLRKYGWILVFIQRYLYGLRTVIPMSIGVTKYSAKKYAFINFISAIVWASITILLSYYFGKEMLNLLSILKEHKEVTFSIVAVILFLIIYYFKKKTE